MSDNKNINIAPETGKFDPVDANIASSEVSSVVGSVKTAKTPHKVSTSTERQIKFERAQKCLENAALVSKRIKEHRKATAELLGKPFEDDDGGDTASEVASTMSERTGYSVATDTSTTIESLANTLKQKELLMERIKQYKEIDKNTEQIINTLKDKENALSVIQVKMRAMETTILDLQEKINEKDQIIEAKNKATSLISDSLSKKERDTMALLEDTRQQMTKMQENFITMETEWKEEKQRYLKDIDVKEEKIRSLEEANSILETSRFEISVEHSKLLEELESKAKEISQLEEKIQSLSLIVEEKPSEKEKDDYDDEKGSREIADMVELTKKVELLEQLNCQIRQTNKELENKLTTITEVKQAAAAPTKKGSPLPARKGGRNTASKMKSPWSHLSSESLPQETDKKIAKGEISRLEMLIQSLSKDLLDKEYLISQKDELITELKKPSETAADMVDAGTITEETESQNTESDDNKVEYDPSMTQSAVEHLNVNQLEAELKKAQEQISLLNNDIEAANKNMIKVKSTHKLKLKQMQKTIDNFSKVSDVNAEIVRLNEELHQLSQKVAEVEEEKGNLQLHLVDYDSGRQLHTLQQKNLELEDKLADISHFQSEQVTTEIKSVQLEEQIDELTASKNELELIIENLKLDKEQLSGTIKELDIEKHELNNKLENYIQENIDLTDKLEKLSAEKVSSAESIEIVESLTTQEKLELEEYNQGIHGEKIEDRESENVSGDKNIDNLIEQREDLNKKIDLFTQEREEVMEKMNKINEENESLHKKIHALLDQCSSLQISVDQCSKEKCELQELNHEINRQIEELKRERIEIVKETAEIAKPVQEDTAEPTVGEVLQDDKTTSDKGLNRTKSVKQLTKEILKLKNTVKEREAEIGDCQMKILSLEEQQQKQNETLKANSGIENKLKTAMDENLQLREELDNLNTNKQSEQQLLEYKQALEIQHQEMQKLQQECAVTTNSRDNRINELEKVLVEYEKQIFNYGNTLQQKDKDLAEYINQVTKLNDVSLKLRSTIGSLEEEKAKDQNADLIKSLNKQIVVYQKKMAENEEKIRILEEEKAQAMLLKTTLENKNINLETELKLLHETFAEKQSIVMELQTQQQKHAEEISAVKLETKERDEEIHEVKLQLRKESIENEKLRTSLEEKEKDLEELTQTFDEAKVKLDKLINENNNFNEQFITIETTNKELLAEKKHFTEQFTTLEIKNKELLEKLKKFAVNIKKKSAMCQDLEHQLMETQKELQAKNEQKEQLSILAETMPALQEKMKHAEEEINRLQSVKISIDQQKTHDLNLLQNQIKALEENLLISSDELLKLKDTINNLHKDLHFVREENANLKTQIDGLNNKIVEHEIEQKNNSNFITKISSLEADLGQKQNYIAELLTILENHEQQRVQTQFGYDAKIQERDLYIESMETEISKYKNRICRLEESISIMEDSRHSLERKADQLGNQLQEKQKAYSEYTNQEDELVGRLAVLMDHDRVVEKQLHEIDGENKELQNKLQQTNEDNQRIRKSLSDIQEYCNNLTDKASKADVAETELAKHQSRIHELEANLKRVTQEQHTLITQKKKEIEEIESEFNTQIENAIKEKKAFSEKYEKINERVIQLETKLQEYKTNNEHLTFNLQEINQMNQALVEKSQKATPVTPDYTDQYINEINKLNSIINTKNQEVSDLVISFQELQTNHLSSIFNLESKISELNNKVVSQSSELENAIKEADNLKMTNEYLHTVISQKEESLKELNERKSLTFEMNIPKTEGMIISSTIEALNEEPKPFDWSSLESQIISDDNIASSNPKQDSKKTEHTVQKQSLSQLTADQSVEPTITCKKAYLCYKTDEDTVEKEIDPFNSDEGWGLGESDELKDITPGLSHLNDQIQKLVSEKTKLTADLNASNIKLVKALRKLKELKSTNDVLSNEIKTSKQVSQSTFLDSAIEDELRLTINELENKIEALTTVINKEKRDKESLRKQNEIFNNANDRLTEMKEKMENEIELWKFKFKDANDKVSTLQWGSDTKETPEHRPVAPTKDVLNDKYKEEINKIEKENDELQLVIDQLTAQNKVILTKETQLKNEIDNLNKEVLRRSSLCENCEVFKSQISELQSSNSELQKNMDLLNQNLRDIEVRCNELIHNYDTLKAENESVQLENIHLNGKCSKLAEEIQPLQQLEVDASTKITVLLSELETLKNKLAWYEQQQTSEKYDEIVLELTNKCKYLEEHCLQLKSQQEESYNKITSLETNQNVLGEQSNDVIVSELKNNYKSSEEHCSQLKYQLEEANSKVAILETSSQNVVGEQANGYTKQINELNAKIQNLNAENDSLLSTVTELRSSISSAVDQRGFEIAELWKQHLGQREADFQKTEMELRSQLNASEEKYEQLLDNMQSSSQEETNQMVIMEQVNSLQSKMQDKEQHLRDLQDKYTEVMNQLDMLRSEMQDEKITYENKLLEQQEEYEKVIQELNLKHKEQSDSYKITFKNIQAELAAAKASGDELNQKVEELVEQLRSSEETIIEINNQVHIKDREIYQKANEYSMILAQRNDEFENVRQQLIQYEKKIEDLNYEKESELAILRLKMHENSSYYEKEQSEFESEKLALAEELGAKITECTNLNKQITDLNKTLEEQANKSSELQAALENQELEIVTLKDEIDNLQTMLTASANKMQKHVSFAADTKLASDDERVELMNKELLDLVPKPELDLALYMLHQRDVRCEELTMELTQLLDERDTLQLRLSDSLRFSEELKSKCKAAGLEDSFSSSQETVSELPSFTVEKEQQFVDTHRQGSRTGSMSDPDGDKPILRANRDVRLRHESEQRQLDMQLLQRDVANLPPEAVEQLTQAHHTLSRDSQSTPTVLMNWLRGKSTPKVVHM
ncbi:putative viral A-type inclusion protein [Operophtera brumata]|uniref:Putative viral A-type inclusion protein n=1 Tax=Operophtera brumata TaxID=104452 RepID=A0A0L7LMR3_OPEBR|nr:putative viral A-type inclusion protein [Operophtera brumata]